MKYFSSLAFKINSKLNFKLNSEPPYHIWFNHLTCVLSIKCHWTSHTNQTPNQTDARPSLSFRAKEQNPKKSCLHTWTFVS